MDGRVHETNPMRGFTQVGRACRHRMQDAALAFFAQVLRVTDFLCDPGHQSRRPVRIELVGDENPGPVFIRRDGLRDVVDEIHFRARVTDAGSHLFAGRHFVIGDQALRTVPQVFVLVPRTASGASRAGRLRGFRRRGTLQRLDAGLFIRTDDMSALRVQRGRGGVQFAHRFDLRLERRRIPLWGVEPAFRMVQIKVDLILKNARRSSGKCGGRYLV